MTTSTIQATSDIITVHVGDSIREFTRFDQPLYAMYRTEGGVTERVTMLGSDISRAVYPVNVVLIELQDGSLRITSEGQLS